MSITEINIKSLWPMLDSCMVLLNMPIQHKDKKVRDGSIEHEKFDREKIAGEALGIALCIAELSGKKLDDIRAEAIERYEHRRR